MCPSNIIIFFIVICSIVVLYIVSKDHNIDRFDPLTAIRVKPYIFDDKLFKDVLIYQNDDDRSGLDKCLGDCKGTCVEYGVSGVAHCFPRNTPIEPNYYSQMRNFDNEKEDIDRAGTKLSWPNLR